MSETEPTTESTNVTVAKDGTVSIKTGTIITVVAAVLGTGGGTGVMALLQQPNPEVIQRLEALEEGQARSARLSGIIYKTIIRAHPDAAIPLEDLGYESP